MNIYFLGTCSGTEPMPGRRHTSLVLEHQDKLFWLDAGESCGYTAHIMGLGLLKTEAIFISHPHMDHVGGLPHLIWTLKKLEALTREPLAKEIPVWLPRMELWEGLEKMLFLKGRAVENGLAFKPSRIEDGEIYRHHGLTVTTVHNLHLGQPEDNETWQSFSFLLEAGNKRVVYSGDFKSLDELEPLLEPRVDLLLVETGHHNVVEICSYLVENNKPVREVGFVHHGRAILNNPGKEMAKATAIFGDQVFFAADRMRITL